MPVILLKPSGETYISQWYANRNFSQSERLCAGYEHGRRNVCKTLIRFDLNLPPDAELTRAVLALQLYDIESAKEVAVGVNRILSDYDNAAVTWNTAPSCVPVSGAFIVGGNDAGHCIEADITELARGWAQCSYPNFGLMLTNDSSRAGLAVFSGSGSPSDGPRLSVTFRRRHAGPAGTFYQLRGIQAQLIDGAGVTIADGDPVIFNAVLNDQSLNISYSAKTGRFTIRQPGSYFVTWWIAAKGAEASCVSFGVSLNGGSPVTGVLPDAAGQLTGSALLMAGAGPSTVALVNTTGAGVTIPATGVQANILILEAAAADCTAP